MAVVALCDFFSQAIIHILKGASGEALDHELDKSIRGEEPRALAIGLSSCL